MALSPSCIFVRRSKIIRFYFKVFKMGSGKDRMQRLGARRREDRSSYCAGISDGQIICLDPNRYERSPTLPGTFHNEMASYFQSLQENNCVARPKNWTDILNRRVPRKDQQSHPWQSIRSDHFVVATTHEELFDHLNKGLLTPSSHLFTV